MTVELSLAVEHWISEVNRIEGIFLIVLLQCMVLSNNEITISFSFTALSQREGTYFLFSKVWGASCLVVCKVPHKQITR